MTRDRPVMQSTMMLASRLTATSGRRDNILQGLVNADTLSRESKAVLPRRIAQEFVGILSDISLTCSLMEDEIRLN